jgi:hypothetical protein
MEIILFNDTRSIENARKYYNTLDKPCMPIAIWFRSQGCNMIVSNYNQIVYKFYCKKKYNWFMLKWK